ncbi:MAG: hypothetical protein IJP94_00865 [Clostridia bacterium]|nr:hypothetical protein [Clostridia bacterium]MBQ2670523.1 hypothetical protein [Clostridia bacterium]MBQ3463444.1 hypothetical protein [Clostridia bacterium]MBQ6530589.1 hypothetical protein [Clostridia bacterium]MBQ6558279.1 hypothetical protein [Clostridia bacterium]
MSGRGGTLREIYTLLFEYHHLLPDEIGRQNPWVMMRLLDSLGGNTDEVEYNDHLKMFYGKEI